MSSCVIHPCYKHPVTGVIEDSGGEAAYATGQGMVEGCIGTTGLLEHTAGGQYYLTFRMSLIDYTSEHSFWVQSRGESDWQTPAAGVTGQGSDANGTTNDITIEVPSENCVVRGQMYVEPMGRSVVFYLYPSDFTSGNSTDMTPAMVTAEGGSAGLEEQTDAGEVPTGGEETSQDAAVSEGETGNTEEASGTAPSAEASVGTSDGASGAAGSTKAEGLSLSTAQDVAAGEDVVFTGSAVATQIFINVISLLIAGSILIAIAAGVVYYFARNWHRIAGNHEDDEWRYEEDEE